MAKKAKATKKKAAKKTVAKKTAKPVKKKTAAKKTSSKKTSAKKTASKSIAKKTAKKAAKKTAIKKPLISKAMIAARKKKKTAKAKEEAVVEKPKPVIKNNFNAAQNREFSGLLLRKRTQLLKDIEQMEDGALKSFASNLSTIHIAELGSDVYEQDLTLGLVVKGSEGLTKIHGALQRIKDKTYGICEMCTNPIPIRRLQVIPFAKRCVPCKEKHESELALGLVEDVEE